MTMGVHVLPKHHICLEKNVYVLLAQQNTNMKKEKENARQGHQEVLLPIY